MKKLALFFIIPFFGFTQVKGIQTKDTLDFYDMTICGCPCVVYDNISGTYDYHYAFYDDNHNIGDAEVDKIYNKLVEILSLNGLNIKKPFESIPKSTQIDVNQIKKSYKLGNVKDSRYNYNVGDYLICFLYSNKEIELFIYKDPYGHKN